MDIEEVGHRVAYLKEKKHGKVKIAEILENISPPSMASLNYLPE